MSGEYVPTTEDLSQFIVAYVDTYLGKQRRKRGGGRYEPTESELFAEARAKIATHDATIRAEVRVEVAREIRATRDRGLFACNQADGPCDLCLSGGNALDHAARIAEGRA